MKFKAFLIKYAEIGIKGNNRRFFEDALVRQMKYALKPVGDFSIRKESGRIFVHANEEYDFDEAVESLSHVFGIAGICPIVVEEDKDFEKIAEVVEKYVDEDYADKHFSFKVHVRRADKKYPIPSMEAAARLGERLLEKFEDLSVDVHNPDVMLTVEIRDKVYIYSREIPGPGGMPVGTNGRAMLLLSGGIDSPVAGYMISKRGVSPITLHVVNFTDIQMAIYEKCPHDELTIIMRRYMMKIAEHFANQDNCLSLVTGESIGQVASQTMHSLYVTNEVCQMPVFRPCIGLDKNEIVKVAEKIGTYETSILPYEDCCTIFVAKHPVTKPRLDVIKRSERNLDDCIDELMKTAIETTEEIKINAH